MKRLRSRSLSTLARLQARIEDTYGGSLLFLERLVGRCRVDADCPTGICAENRCINDPGKERIERVRDQCRTEATTSKERSQCDIVADEQSKYTCTAPLMTTTDAGEWNTPYGFGRRGNCIEKYKKCRSEAFVYDPVATGMGKRKKKRANEAVCRDELDRCAKDIYCPTEPGQDYRVPEQRRAARREFRRRMRDPKSMGLEDIDEYKHCSTGMLNRKFDITCPACVVDSDCHRDEDSNGAVCNTGQCVQNPFCAAPEDLDPEDYAYFCNQLDPRTISDYFDTPEMKRAGCTPQALAQKYARTCQKASDCVKPEHEGDKRGAFGSAEEVIAACSPCQPDEEKAIEKFVAYVRRKRGYEGCDEQQLRQKFAVTCGELSPAVVARLLRVPDLDQRCRDQYLQTLPVHMRVKTMAGNALQKVFNI